MAERRFLASLPDAELERALRRVGRHVAFPPTPDVAFSVRVRIAAGAPERPGRLLWFTPRRALVAAAVALLFVLAGTLALFGGARDAVADLFGVRGIEITFEREEAPTAIPAPVDSPVGPDLSLGRQVTLAEARELAPFEVHVPDVATYGEPDEVYVRTLPDDNTMVSLIYHPTAGLPEAAETGVGALLMQFEARDNVAIIGKGIFGGARVEHPEVAGTDGFWIIGATEMVILDDPSMGCCRPSRPSANVLLWEQDGLTFRLESSLTRSSAVEMAESMATSNEEES